MNQKWQVVKRDNKIKDDYIHSYYYLDLLIGNINMIFSGKCQSNLLYLSHTTYIIIQ